MSATKIVKRYANRKLYDTERSCYVTLDDIAIMIRAGDEVRVIDNKSGEDLTSVTLAQIIFETEKKNSFMPLSLLRGLIQDSGEAIGEFARDRVSVVQGKAEEYKAQVQKFRTDLEGRIQGVIGKPGEPGTNGTNGTHADGRPKMVAELISASQKAFEELQHVVEERVKGPAGAVTRYANLGTEMDEIRKRLVELETRLEKFPQ